MEVILLLAIIVGTSAQNVLKKAYGNKIPSGGVFIFSALTVLSATLIFVASASYPLNFSLEILPYALGFAAAYCAATIFNMLAIREGSLSLTSLAVSYSLLIPTLFGLLFYGDEASVWFFIGLLLLMVSLFLINDKGRKEKKTATADDVAIPSATESSGEGRAKITLKWLIFVVLAFLGNGLCSTVQNGYARTHSTGSSELMIIALITVFLVLICAAFISERTIIVPSVKGGWLFMVICGLANGAVNLFVILLSPLMDTSVMFPLISAGGIVLTSLVSIFLYKEKLSLRQYIGMAMGIGSIIFMNL